MGQGEAGCKSGEMVTSRWGKVDRHIGPGAVEKQVVPAPMGVEMNRKVDRPGQAQAGQLTCSFTRV
jgi:hypothetical protein